MVLFYSPRCGARPALHQAGENLLACRNLLIFFEHRALQRRLIPLFHYILRPGGVLVLGTAETAGRFNNLFNPINAKLRTYLSKDGVTGTGADLLLQSFPSRSRATKESAVPTASKSDHASEVLQTAADYVLLQTYAPAAVVVNTDGDIVYISGRTGKYLEPAAGKADWNFHAMVREGLRTPLANALKRAAEQDQPVQMQGLPVELSAGTQYVDVTVQAFHEPPALDGTMMVVFRDVPPVPTKRPRGGKQGTREQSRAEEIQRYQNEVQRLREESRASHEELQSTNEELQSTNEELQSANEELSTSKEEMQSMNEELQAINAELRTKLDDLALAQSDMQNVLNSIEIAILFLDSDLNVRRYTDRAADIINLRGVISAGRSVT
ncbi:MAG: CheR family methyltransferase [Gammaproteobacteria bacterium]|nr:CheR family methyltransferase [Gammaproteobacteria bacterium]